MDGRCQRKEISVTLCSACGLQTNVDTSICSHHHLANGDDWAVSNRIICDLIHRRLAPIRLTLAQLADEYNPYPPADVA